jgi:RNA polymerase sigma-70 factor (ECF subfamily)
VEADWSDRHGGTVNLAGLRRDYERLLPVVYGYVRRRVGAAGAEDIVADVFFAAVEALQSGRINELTAPWMLGVARNKVMDHWRRRYRTRRRDQFLREAAVEVLFTDLTRERAQEALDGLPDAYRAVLTLHHMDGLPVGEVAGVIGRSVRATESLLARARRAFRRSFEELADE